MCTFEAELALLLRIGHNYGKLGTQVLFSMGALEHLASCKMVGLQIKGSFRLADAKVHKDVSVDIDKQRIINSPILRFVCCLTSLVDSSDFLEVKDKIVHQIIDLVKAHQSFFDQVLREDISEADDLTLEQISLVVAILSKASILARWNDEYGFIQGLFGMMRGLFSLDIGAFSSIEPHENHKKSELILFRLSFSLCTYLYFLVAKKALRLQVSDAPGDYHMSGGGPQPTLSLLVSLLSSVRTALERVAEEKSLLLNKIQDINELSRQEVDEIINVCKRQECVSPSDNIRKRRYIAMVEMCRVAGNRDQLTTLLLQLAEQVLNILLIHFQESTAITKSSVTMEMVVLGSKTDSREDISFLCGKLLPILERLELLGEDKMGQGLKVFRRLVTSLKELTIRKLAP
ncbi:nuclear pore complex protein NUP205 [Cinnamomum micranthum f. kanehirae]|uniref:Nuclear pore complex protein NUP205 n=1 Tax=Cinnamomum micranthum f. kanehirae TaxID=337451 RepID=A0A3S3MR65_9MAGN|nr:nuclear pore complex protein NUP205 [Cinnamomum micranthum f. kanehirae]